MKPIIAFLLFLFLVVPAQADDRSLFTVALGALDRGNAEQAYNHAQGLSDKLLRDYITGEALRDGYAPSWEVARDFLLRYPNWPRRQELQATAESALVHASDHELVARTVIEKPVTSGGLLRMCAADLASGRNEAAVALMKEAWKTGGFGAQEEEDILGRYGHLLSSADHEARLDRLIWKESFAAAQRMLPRVDGQARRSAEARIALLSNAKNAAALVDSLGDLADDPGVVYARIKWRSDRDDTDGAIALLQSQPPIAADHAEDWWKERHIIIRRLFETRDWKRAYALAANSGQTAGLPFATAEFTAGWIALRFLNETDRARGHFQRMYDGVQSPISRARAAYWLGRAHEADKDISGARRWYDEASDYPTTFYGQLSLAKLEGQNTVLRIPQKPSVPSGFREAYLNDGIAGVIAHLIGIEEFSRAGDLFPAATAGAKTEEEYALLAELAERLNRPDLGVKVAKAAIQNGVVLPEHGYPVRRLAGTAMGVEPGLVHAFIRQESEFKPDVVSSAGAVGLMQLLPSTAKQVARKNGFGYSRDTLYNPERNMELGSAFVAELLENYGGSYIMTIAAYNAGPGRVREWRDTFGDPRVDMDPIDWLELIPIYETRNYVQRVLEGLQVYRARLAGGEASLQIVQDVLR